MWNLGQFVNIWYFVNNCLIEAGKATRIITQTWQSYSHESPLYSLETFGAL